MKDFGGKIEYKDKVYNLPFNLNVMEEIQEEYGSVDKWAELSDGKGSGEPNAKAVIFGFTSMINEGIDIENEENGTDLKHLTKRQVARMITEVGLVNAVQTLNNTVVESTQSDEKNA